MKGTLIQWERELDEEIEDETYRERLVSCCSAAGSTVVYRIVCERPTIVCP